MPCAWESGVVPFKTVLLIIGFSLYYRNLGIKAEGRYV